MTQNDLKAAFSLTYGTDAVTTELGLDGFLVKGVPMWVETYDGENHLYVSLPGENHDRRIEGAYPLVTTEDFVAAFKSTMTHQAEYHRRTAGLLASLA